MLLTAIVSYRLPRIVTISPTSSILSFCPRRPWASKASIATLRDSRWTELLKVYWEVKTSNLKLNRDQLTEKLKFNQVVGYSSDLCPDRLLGQVLHLQLTRVMSVVMTNVNGWKKIQKIKFWKIFFEILDDMDWLFDLFIWISQSDCCIQIFWSSITYVKVFSAIL